MRKFLHAIAALCIAFSATYAAAQEPKNISVVKKQLIKYHDSGEYNKDINQVLTEALVYLKQRVSQRTPGQKLAIVLDIDETSLSNYKDMRELNFGGTFDEIQLAMDKGQDSVIESTLKLYNYAKSHDIAIFFITGRNENERQLTILNLKAAGFNHWDKLILRKGEYLKTTATVYKTAARKKLVEEGYDIIVNIGDQQSDLTGGYADKTYKLPNPYYFIP